ncbi:MAG: hypothetical protein IPO17_12825 [Flavobacteriales bacterium]|nr:hypothetical protein [Flavobacteriales bacterium]
MIKAERAQDPGIGSSFERPLDRLVDKDGSFRVQRTGGISGLREGFIALATMPIARLVVTFVCGYLGMNLVLVRCTCSSVCNTSGTPTSHPLEANG